MKNGILIFCVTMTICFFNINCSKNLEGLARIDQTLSGAVDLGSPVSGSNVTAYMFRKGERGDVLGTGMTDEHGKYQIEHHNPYRGPVLFVAQNGSFVDPTTKIQMFMPDKQTLLSAIEDSRAGSVANINAVSTLAVTLLETPIETERLIRFSKDSEKAESNWVGTVLAMFAGHFDRETWKFNFLTTSPWDPTQKKLGPSENRVLLYLVHAGLSQMAQDLSKATGQEPGSIRILDLLYLLSLDASDAVLDGKQKQVQLFIDKGNSVPLDSYFLRHKLAGSIQIYLNTLKESHVDVGFDGKSFAAHGGFYERISMDNTSPFPAKGADPIPFDTDPPEIKMVFLGDYANSISGDLLYGNVTIEALATDKISGLKSLKIIEPKEVEPTTQEDGKLTFEVTPSMIPNADQALKACGFSYRDLAHGVGNIEEHATAFCVCVEARDALDNVSHRVRCVGRPDPLAEISNKGTINIETLGEEAFEKVIPIEGKIVSGFSVLTCGWQVFSLDGATKVGDVALPWGTGSITRDLCTVHGELKKDQLPDGNYTLRIIGTDLVGESLDPDSTREKLSFSVYQTPPVLEITSPEAEIRTNASKIDLLGTIKSGVAIRDVYVEMVQGQWNESKSKRRYDGALGEGRWMIHIQELPEAVAYTYVVHAVDIYGNHSQLAPRLIVVDRQPPTINGHREGIPQGSYAQEHSTVSVLRSGTPGMLNFQFKPNGTQTRIPWDNIPVLYRWANLVAEENTAPSYQIEVKDDSGIQEVRWAHGKKCAQVNEAHSFAHLTDGVATLPLSSASALDSLEEAIDDSKMRCLSVWAVDKAGNTKNQQISFKWRTVAPPIVVDFNSPLYDPTKSEDDMAFSKYEVQDVYNLAEHSKDKDGYVVAHALLHNPHDIDLNFKMEENLVSSIELKLKEMVVLGKDTVTKDWVYHGTTEEIYLPGEPMVPDRDWIPPLQRYGALMHPSGSSNHPTKSIHAPVYDLLSNPKSSSSLFGSMKDCSERQPAYTEICGANEVVLLGERNVIVDQRCDRLTVECLPASHRYGVVNTRNKPVSVVGEQVVTKQSTLVQLHARYFAFDPARKQVQEEVLATEKVLKIPSGKSMLVKWYLSEQNIQIGLKSLEGVPNTQFVGECKKILYSKNTDKTCDKAECKLDQVCFNLDGIQVRLVPKVSVPAQKKGVGILSSTPQSSFRYSTQTDTGAISDDFVPVVLESPISRLVTQ